MSFCSSTSFVYDGLNPVQEKVGASVTANILPGLGIDEYFTRTDSAGTSSVLSDALGSSVALTDSSGTLQTQYTYEPFGNTTAAGAVSTNSFQYTGRENDGTGLYYYRARYYSPRMQRFISEDPIGFGSGDVNWYAYVGNSPLNYYDPYGLRVGSPLPGISGGTGDAIGSAAGAVIGGRVGGGLGADVGATVGGILGLPWGPVGVGTGIVVGGYVGGIGGGLVGGLVGGLAGGQIGGLFDPPCAGQLNCNEQIPEPPNELGRRK